MHEMSSGARAVNRRGEEDRRFPRVTCPPLLLSTLPAVVHDVSVGGICLHTRERVAPGQQFELLLTDAELYHTQELKAEVMWSRFGQVGLRWLDLSEQQQEWLHERFRDWQASQGNRTEIATAAQNISWGW